ncbi:MAG UNVERIFIED_CONTAM: hypothetical protein LVR29_16405 [Microcystis novacekii LVE1205-3]|jgi:hypothetical protein
MLDPILEELRQIRYQIEKDCQDNPQILSEYLYRVQSQYSERLVRRSPQPALQIAPGIKVFI